MQRFDAEIKRFSNSVKVPHMGWNTIDNLKSDLFKGINSGAYMYSVHSYYEPLTKQSIAKTSYELPFSAALHHKNFYGVQFHPEKSHKFGMKIFENFIHNIK